MKNILLVNYYDLESGGGTSSVTFSLAKELKRKGDNVFIASTGKYPGIKTFVFKKIRFIPLFVARDSYLKYVFKKIVKKYRIEILHICDSRFSSVAAIGVGKKNNIPCVVHYHDYWFNCLRGDLLYHGKEFCSGMKFFKCLSCQKKNRILWEAYKYLYFKKRLKKLITAEAHIAISTTIENELKKSNIKKISRIPNMINLCVSQDKERLRKEFGSVLNFIKEKKVVSFVGRLVENKGVRNFLETAKITIQKNKNIVFLIIGDGEMNLFCCKYIKKYDLSKNIKMLGYVDNKKIDFLYLYSNVVLLPTNYYEVFPMVTIEAMKSAKVVITSNKGGNKELIDDGKNGILVDPANIQKMSDIVLKVISNNELMIAIGLAAQASVKDFSRNKVIRKVVNLYAKLLENKKYENSHRL